MTPELVTLYGKPRRALQSPIVNANPNNLSNFDAGLMFFKLVADLYPGIRFSEALQLHQSPQMAGWWTDLKKGAGDLYGGVKTVIGDTVEGIGDVGGSTVRLAADPQVANTVSRAGMAYASGGSSEGLMAVFQSLGQQGVDLFNTAGEKYKQTGMPGWTMWAGIGLAGVLILVLAMRD